LIPGDFDTGEVKGKYVITIVKEGCCEFEVAVCISSDESELFGVRFKIGGVEGLRWLLSDFIKEIDMKISIVAV